MSEIGRGLLMDLDGTIVDTLPYLCTAFRYALEPFVTRPPTDPEIVATFGPPERENLRRMLTNPALAPPEAVEHLEDAVQRFLLYYEEHHDQVRIFPGIVESLHDAVQQGWRIGILTGKGRRSAMYTLLNLNLWPMVGTLVSGTDVLHPKPDPQGVWAASQHLDIPLGRMIVVGDSPGDITAGRTAGTKTAAALWGAFDPDATRRAGADWELEHGRQLMELLRYG